MSSGSHKKNNNKVKTTPLPYSAFLFVSRPTLKRSTVVWMHILIWTGQKQSGVLNVVFK